MKPRLIIILAALLLILFLSVNYASAAFVNCGGPGQAECKISNLVQTVVNITNFLLSWAWLVATLFIVWAGWEMVNAGGNEEAVSAAKTTLTNAIIGFFLIMAAFVLINFIIGVLTGDLSLGAGKFFEAFSLLP